jgi:hypothetical protein
VTPEELRELEIPDDVQLLLDRIGDQLDAEALRSHVAKLGKQYQFWSRLLAAAEELERIRKARQEK